MAPYSPEIALALIKLRDDETVQLILTELGKLFRNSLPSTVNVQYDGRTTLLYNKITSGLIADLRAHLRHHILQFYPVLAYLYPDPNSAVNPGVHTALDTWIHTKSSDAPLGEFLVITPDEYAIKAIHYGGNDWQKSETYEKVKVEWYQPLPGNPPGFVRPQKRES